MGVKAFSDMADDSKLEVVWQMLTLADGGGKRVREMIGGGVWTSAFLANIICEHPLM